MRTGRDGQARPTFRLTACPAYYKFTSADILRRLERMGGCLNCNNLKSHKTIDRKAAAQCSASGCKGKHHSSLHRVKDSIANVGIGIGIGP